MRNVNPCTTTGLGSYIICQVLTEQAQPTQMLSAQTTQTSWVQTTLSSWASMSWVEREETTRMEGHSSLSKRVISIKDSFDYSCVLTGVL